MGSVSANDPDSGDTLTYSLGGGPFTIDSATGAITVIGALDFESTPSYSLTVTVTDRPTLTLGTVSPTAR